MRMIKQNLLTFKTGISKDILTSRSGLALYSEFMRAYGIKELIDRLMPEPGSNSGYSAWQYIEPILLMFIGCGRHIEELREITEDKDLRRLVKKEVRSGFRAIFGGGGNKRYR